MRERSLKSILYIVSSGAYYSQFYQAALVLLASLNMLTQLVDLAYNVFHAVKCIVSNLGPLGASNNKTNSIGSPCSY